MPPPPGTALTAPALTVFYPAAQQFQAPHPPSPSFPVPFSIPHTSSPTSPIPPLHSCHPCPSLCPSHPLPSTPQSPIHIHYVLYTIPRTPLPSPPLALTIPLSITPPPPSPRSLPHCTSPPSLCGCSNILRVTSLRPTLSSKCKSNLELDQKLHEEVLMVVWVGWRLGSNLILRNIDVLLRKNCKRTDCRDKKTDLQPERIPVKTAMEHRRL